MLTPKHAVLFLFRETPESLTGSNPSVVEQSTAIRFSSVRATGSDSALGDRAKCRRIGQNYGNLISVFISFFRALSRPNETSGYSGHVDD